VDPVDPKQFDAIARLLVSAANRRRALRALLGGAVGVLGVRDAAARNGACEPACGDCGTCQKGTCKKKRGKKRCKPGVCLPNPNGGACENNPCKSCQNGQCTNRATGTACQNNPCKECRNGTCSNKTNGSGCQNNSCKECQNGTCVNKAGNSPCTGGLCLDGSCNPPTGCRSLGQQCSPIGTQGGCCGPICTAIGPTVGACLTPGPNGFSCNIDADCTSAKCRGFRCVP
jgi:hypothetical protein